MKRFLTVFAITGLTLSFAIGGTLAAPTANAQMCPLNYNGDTGMTVYGPCQAAGVYVPPGNYVPGTSVTALNGPQFPSNMGGCPLNYNGDIGAVTAWGPCNAMSVSPA